MHKLEKLLNKYNKQYLFKLKTNVSQHKLYEKELLRQGLFFKVVDDNDFIRFEVVKTSYDNMRSIQKAFFEYKHELRDIWNVISYQEKHFLLYQKLSPFMDKLKHFNYDGKRYFIAYFDDLINAYYDHDMLMFDNEAYRKYLYDFNKIIIDQDKYGVLPLKADFSQAKFIVGDNDDYVLYSKAVNRFYHYYGSNTSYGISKELSDEQIANIANLILNRDKEAMVNYLIENDLGNKRLIKKLKRIAKKF